MNLRHIIFQGRSPYPFHLPLSSGAALPREAKLRKKKIGKVAYWFTKAGGDTYFGRVDVVPYKEARKLFQNHVGSLSEDQNNSKVRGLTAGELMDVFLDWIEHHRSDRTYATR